MSTSDTPRTDEQINGKPCTRFSVFAGDSLRDALVPSDFARQLERELSDANSVALRYAGEIDRLKEEIEQNAWKSSPALAQAQIDQLNARIAELERDRARLDWLDRNPMTYERGCGRAAIDQAMSEANNPQTLPHA